VKEPVWVDLRDALAIHDRLLFLYRGSEGLRDQGLLESALARPQPNPDLADVGAALISGIVRNHPFIDGNKRTGFVLGVMFLELNGLKFTATEEDANQAVRLLAAGALDEAGFKNWLSATIADWPKRNPKK
jgi:death-on-curing protein